MSSVGSTSAPVPPLLMSVNGQPPCRLMLMGLSHLKFPCIPRLRTLLRSSLRKSPPVASPSPAISSFTSDSCSQSILKDASIVSSDPMVVEQISSESDVNSNVTGQVVIDLDNSNVTGPNVA